MAYLDKLSKDGVFMSEYEQMKYEKCVREDGFADGKAEGRADIIRLMHKNGASIEEISKLTNITTQEIETILSAK